MRKYNYGTSIYELNAVLSQQGQFHLTNSTYVYGAIPNSQGCTQMDFRFPLKAIYDCLPQCKFFIQRVYCNSDLEMVDQRVVRTV